VGNQCAKHLLEENPFAEGLFEWMDSPEGELSNAALDAVFDALAKADIDPRKRKIVWEDGQRLSIPETVQRIHASNPDLAPELIESHVLGWLEGFAPESYSERQLEELDRLTDKWVDDHERKSEAGSKQPRTRHS